MKIKILFFALGVLISFTTVFAQKKKQIVKHKMEDVLNTTFLVPLDKDYPEYSLYLKQCIEKYWTFNEYKFIEEEDVISYLSDPKYSLLIYSTYGGIINTQTNMKSQIKVRYSIVLGKPNITIMVNQALTEEFENQIAVSCFLPTSKTEYKKNEFPHPTENKAFLPIIIKTLQNSLKELNYKKEKIINKKEHKKIEKEMDEKRIKERDSIYAARNILVHENFLSNHSQSSLARFIKTSVDKIFIVSEEDIITAIEKQDSNVLIYFPIQYENGIDYTFYKPEVLEKVIQPKNLYFPFMAYVMFAGVTCVFVGTMIFLARLIG